VLRTLDLGTAPVLLRSRTEGPVRVPRLTFWARGNPEIALEIRERWIWDITELAGVLYTLGLSFRADLIGHHEDFDQEWIINTRVRRLWVIT
jgi:hypothetical protein